MGRGVRGAGNWAEALQASQKGCEPVTGLHPFCRCAHPGSAGPQRRDFPPTAAAGRRVRLVTMAYYRTMTKRQAAKALGEYLTERPGALQRLRDELAADGLDPDGIPQSLTPLWRWVATCIMAVEDDPTSVSRDVPAPPWWPSWTRYSSDLRRSTPVEVVTTGAPQAVWPVGRHRIKACVTNLRQL